MWKTFVYDNENYIIKTVKSTNHKIILCDMTNIWEEELSSEGILRRCKAMNPLFTADDNDTFINKILEIMNDITSLGEFVLRRNSDGIAIECKTKLVHMPFKFHFFLKPAGPELFCKEVTIPLINTINVLEEQQSKLLDLLEKKDTEIQQHVFEHGELKRKNIATEKFDRSILTPSSSNNLCCNIFSKSEDFLKILTEKYNCSDTVLKMTTKEEQKHVKKKSVTKRILGKKPNRN